MESFDCIRRAMYCKENPPTWHEVDADTRKFIFRSLSLEAEQICLEAIRHKGELFIREPDPESQYPRPDISPKKFLLSMAIMDLKYSKNMDAVVELEKLAELGVSNSQGKSLRHSVECIKERAKASSEGKEENTDHYKKPRAESFDCVRRAMYCKDNPPAWHEFRRGCTDFLSRYIPPEVEQVCLEVFRHRGELFIKQSDQYPRLVGSPKRALLSHAILAIAYTGSLEGVSELEKLAASGDSYGLDEIIGNAIARIKSDIRRSQQSR